jgi:hypothetical protein
LTSCNAKSLTNNPAVPDGSSGFAGYELVIIWIRIKVCSWAKMKPISDRIGRSNQFS